MNQRRLSKPVALAILLCVIAGYAAVLWLLELYGWLLVKNLVVLGVFVLQLVALMWSWSQRGQKLDAKKQLKSATTVTSQLP